MLLVSVLLLNVGVIIAQLLNPEQCGVNIVIEKQVRPPSLVKNAENTNGLGVWPWICSVGFVENDSWDHQCGGTLITYRHMLTAAHCPTTFRKRADRIIVRCGDYHLKNETDNQNVQIKKVKKFKNHESYGYLSAHYDIAILYFENDFKATKYVRPICLQSPTKLERQEPAIVVGWGKDENGEAGNELKETTLQILDSDTCENRVGKVKWITDGFGDDLFCAVDPKGWTVEVGGSGSGKGDSGGPIFSLKTSPSLRYELKGLVNAGTRKIPDIYTRTGFPKIHKWIVDNVECSDGQHCVSEEKCPALKTKFDLFRSDSTNKSLKETIKQELKALICDRQNRLLCCTQKQPGALGIDGGLMIAQDMCAQGMCASPAGKCCLIIFSVEGLLCPEGC